jgi:apolipoprotein N-acyltransferase
MGSELDRNSTWLMIAALVVAGSARFWGTGLHPIWWLTWLSVFPVLLLSPRVSRRAAFAVAALTSLLGGLNMWTYFRHVLETPLIPVLVILLVPSLVFGLAVLVFRKLVLVGNAALAVFVFPAFWTGCEYLVSISSPHSTAGNIAYSQMNFLPLLQLAAVTGIWGIDFCLMLFAAATATFCMKAVGGGQRVLIVMATGVLFLTVFGYGEWRLNHTASGPSIRVGLVASDLPENALPHSKEDSLRLLREYAREAETLSASGAQLVIAPEKIAVVSDDYIDEIDRMFQGVATRSRNVIVIGVARRSPGKFWNAARIYLSDQTAPLLYAKHHMLPFFESRFTVGTDRVVLQQSSGKWGVTICKDMDFPPLSREYGLKSAGLLFVPAWDFDSDGWLHGRMGILRGVESGFSIVRAPRHGILTISDSRGRVVAERATSAAPFATLLAELPVQHVSTLYARWGDWFAWLCLVGLVTLFFWRWWK